MRRTLLVTSLASAATALVGGLGTDPLSRWYRSLAKPSCNRALSNQPTRGW